MLHIENLMNRFPQLATCKDPLMRAVECIVRCYKHGGMLLVCGNGGSCADAEHIAGELMKGFCKKRQLAANEVSALTDVHHEIGLLLAKNLQQGLRTVCLSSLPALSTAFANDVDPVLVFAQQAYTYAKADDVFLGISTSGNAKNVICAAVAAKAKGATTIGLTGKDGGDMKDLFDIVIIAPETETYRIQELHVPLYHALCLEVEDMLF